MPPLPDTTRFWHPVLPARKLRERPVAVTLCGRRYALWRGPGGTPNALPDACPHRQAPLSRGTVQSDGRLACAYHGWNFDGEGHGRCPSQPNLKVEANALQVAERHGYLWMARRSTPIESLPALAFEGFAPAGNFAMEFQAPLHIMLDNFAEDEHFPYVHAAFGWRPEDWDKVEFEAKTSGEATTEALYVGPQRASPVITLLGAKAGDLFVNRIESRFDPVCHVYSSHWEDPVTRERRPVEARTVVFQLPETERTTRFHTFLFLRVAPRTLHSLARPVLEHLALNFVRAEWWMDGRWTRHLADTAVELKGLRLGKYDKTLIRNRKLLKTLYYGVPDDADGAADRRSLDVVS